MNERTRRLHIAMRQYNLSAAEVARIVQRKPNTVRAWRCESGKQTIPANTLLMLELILRQRPKK